MPSATKGGIIGGGSNREAVPPIHAPVSPGNEVDRAEGPRSD